MRTVRTIVATTEPFEVWLRGMSGPGYRLAFAMLHDRSQAEDALQEATLKAWRNFGKLDPNRAALPWFLAIVANCCRSGRRDRRRITLPLFEGMAATQDETAVLVDKHDLRRALLSLKPEDRLIVVLRYYLDLPLSQVAEIAGMNLATLKTRLYRAVKTLRPAVEFEAGLS